MLFSRVQIIIMCLDKSSPGISLVFILINEGCFFVSPEHCDLCKMDNFITRGSMFVDKRRFSWFCFLNFVLAFLLQSKLS